jgi:hypothetical protein
MSASGNLLIDDRRMLRSEYMQSSYLAHVLCSDAVAGDLPPTLQLLLSFHSTTNILTRSQHTYTFPTLILAIRGQWHCISCPGCCIPSS